MAGASADLFNRTEPSCGKPVDDTWKSCGQPDDADFSL